MNKKVARGGEVCYSACHTVYDILIIVYHSDQKNDELLRSYLDYNMPTLLI